MLTSIRQRNSLRSRITQRIWPASRCGPQSHPKVCELGGRHRQSGIQPLRSGPRHSRIRPARGGNPASCACNVVGANQRYCRLLRPRHHRPRNLSAAEKCDELAASYSSHFQPRQIGTSCTKSVKHRSSLTLWIRHSFTGAVGTRVTSCPPLRSVHAAFPHTAPTSGV